MYRPALRQKFLALLFAILPAFIVGSLVFGANMYYDLDAGKIMVNEDNEITGSLTVSGTGDILFSTSGSINQSGTGPVTFTGNVGIGQAVPAAALHLKAGTAAANTAPLKLAAGINLAAPEAGAIEFDGTNLYFTPSTTRKTIAFDDSIHGAVTLAGENYLSLSAQQITANAINLASANVIGILPLANGGTNANLTAVNGGIVYSGASALAISAAGTSGQALISGGAGTPAWFTPTAGSILFAGTGGILAQDNPNFFWDDANNRLGIGTAAPATALNVLSAAGAQLRLSYNAGNYADLAVSNVGELSIQGSGASGSIVTIGDASENDAGIVFDGNAQDYYAALDDTDDGFKIGLGNVIGTTPYLTILSTGNIGIGTISPAQKLHVEGQCVTGDSLLPIVSEEEISNFEFRISNQNSNDLILNNEKNKNSDIQNLFKIQNSKLEFKPIKDIKGGEYVLSLNEKTGGIEPAKIKGLLDMGVKPVFRLTTESGKTIRTTGNHPYLAVQQGIESGKLKVEGVNPDHLTEEYEFGQTKTVWQEFDNQKTPLKAMSLDAESSGVEPHSDKESLRYQLRAAAVQQYSPSVSADLLYQTINKKQSQENIRTAFFENSSKNVISQVDTYDHYSISENLVKLLGVDNLENAEWTKVIYLQPGDEIAVAEISSLNSEQVLWDKISSIECVGEEQVYDIEVEGTHNFIANEILAHNTYLSGNVGIGTTSPTAKLDIAQTITATGALKGIVYTGAINTNQTLSTEIPSLTLTTAGRQWATGALATQREVLITQPTYSFVGASTITNAATLGIAGAPVAGTNATLTNSHGLLVQAGAVAAGTTNSYGLTVNAQTGATNNYAAAFLGGNVGIGTITPSYSLDIAGNMGITGSTTLAGTNYNKIGPASHEVITVTALTSTAIQAAINALPAGGGKVFLPEGTYNITATITIPSNVWLEGAGNSSTILRLADGVNASVIANSDQTNGNSYIKISNLKIDGNDAGNTGTNCHGIYFNKVTYSEVDSAYVYDAEDYGIYLFYSGSGNGYNKITNNTIESSGNTGIRLYTIYNNTITGNHSLSNSSNGIQIDYSHYNVIANNVSTGNAVDGIGFAGSSKNTVTANTIYNNSGHGIDLLTGCVGNTISSNNIYIYGGTGNYDGIQIYDSDNNIISSNRISDNNGTGYAIDISLSASDNNVLVGNYYSGTGASAINDAGTDTKYTMPNRLTVNANNTDYGAAVTALTVTQSGTGKIVSLNDGTNNEVFAIADSGQTTFKPAAFDTVYTFDGAAAYADNTAEAKTSAGTAFAILALEASSNDEFYLGLDHPFNTVYFDIAAAGAGVTLSAQYYVAAWTALTITDNTTNLTTDGTVTFTAPTDWAATAINGQTKYWVKFRSPGTSITTAPTAYSVSPTTGNRFYVYGQSGDTSPALYVNDKGNVGIGTTTPGVPAGNISIGAKLDVNGNQYLRGDLVFPDDQTERYIRTAYFGGAIRFRSNLGASSDRDLQFGSFDNGNTWYPKMTILSQLYTGVGIDDTSPDAPLEVVSNSGFSNVFLLSSAANANGDLLTVKSTGNVGIGLISPTAALHLKAGTTAAGTAPLKFTSGALLTAAEAGAVEFLDDAFYGTITTGAARKQFAFTDSAMTGTFDGLNFNAGNPGGMAYYSAADAISSSAAGTSGQALISGGAGSPTWYAPTAGSVLFAGASGILAQDNSKLFWDDTNYRLGIGTATPAAALHIGSGSPSSLTTYGDSVYISGELEVGETTYLGPMEFGANSGAISWIDMPVTSSASIGTVESYTAKIDGTDLLAIYAESNGAGGIQNSGVGIGTATPTEKLTIQQDSAGNLLGLYDGANNTVLAINDSGQTTFKPSAFDTVYTFDGAAAYADNTAEAKTSAGTAFAILALEASSNDEFYLGLDHPFNTVYFDIAAAGAGVTLSAQYYVAAWTALTITDNTTNLTTDGTVTFTAPTDWAATAINGQTKYWVRFRSPATSITTAPTAYSVSPTTGNRFYVYGQSGDTAPALYVNDKGNVGIGTITPNNLIQVADLINFYNTDLNTSIGYQAGKNVVSGAQYNTFLGYQAGYSDAASTNAADNNTAIGTQALYSNTVGGLNSAMGVVALKSNTEGYANSAMGAGALYSNTTGYSNAALGRSALYRNQTGSFNTVMGMEAGYGVSANSFSNSTLVGYRAGYGLTTGNNNILIGYQAGDSITSAGDNTIIGYQAGQAITTTVTRSTFLGYQAGYANTTGVDNTLMGYTAGDSLTTGGYNTLIGSYAGQATVSGARNTFLGYQAGYVNTASDNTFIGYQAGDSNIGGMFNTFLGVSAGQANTSGNYNTAMGMSVLYSNTTGISNLAMGNYALYSNTEGSDNLAMGRSALYNTTSNDNLAMGNYALFSNITGSANTVLGVRAGYGVSSNSFSNSTLIGYRAGYGLSTGSNNLLLGYQAGDNLTTGASNIVIGYDIDAPLATSANTLNIGNLLFGTGIDGTGTTLSSGKIGIGTVNPQQKLTLGSASSFAVEMAVPASPSATPTTGGTLTADTYYYKVTALDGAGETAGSSEVSCIVDGAATTACQINWTASTGAASYRIYGRATGAQDQYWTATTNTYTDDGTAGTAGTVPTITTSYVNKLAASGNSWVLGGNLGIGTATPNNLIQVADLINFNNTDFNTSIGYQAGKNVVSGAQLNTFLGYQAGYSNIASTNAADWNTAVGYRAFYSNISGSKNTAIGDYALFSNTSGYKNTAIGSYALSYNTDGSKNSAMGYNALYFNSTGSYNTAIGQEALYFNNTGSYNTIMGMEAGYGVIDNSFFNNSLFGYRAGYGLTTGSNSVLIGYQAGDSVTSAIGNVAVGYQSGQAITTNTGNAFLGYQSGYSNTAANNTFLGYSAGYANTSAAGSVAIGYQAGDSMTIGGYNVVIGYQAGQTMSAGTNNTFIGYQAGYLSTSNYSTFIGSNAGDSTTAGTYNTFIGMSAGQANVSGGKNTYLGYESGYFNIADFNTFIGYQSGYSSSTESTITADYNTAIGHQTLYSNTTGYSNSAIGYNALNSNTSGAGNSAVGTSALLYNTIGGNNSAMGGAALYSNTEGSQNSAMGYYALRRNQTGSANTAMGMEAGYGVLNNSFSNNSLFGYRAGYGLSTGSNNILLGYQAGDNLTTGASNIIIGYDIDAPLATSANTLNIGNLLFGTGIDGTGTTLSSGNIGIGTAAPGSKLTVAGSITLDNTTVVSGALADAPATGACAGQLNSATQAVFQTSTSVISSHIFYNSTRSKHARITSAATCVDGSANTWQILTLTDSITGNAAADSYTVYNPAGDAGTTVAGFINNLYAINGKFVTATVSGGFDIAEEYQTNDESIEAGDAVSIDPNNPLFIAKSSASYDKKLLGIISTNPGLSLGNETIGTWRKVALSGRVAVKASLENGAIEAGDYLTSSSEPGVAMRATEPGMVIGMALEEMSNVKCQMSNQCQMINDQLIGRVMVFVNPHWSLGSLDENGALAGSDQILENTNQESEILESFIGNVKQALASLGVIIENGIAQVKELAAERITGKEAQIEKVRMKKIEMEDAVTGEIYCTWIENGEWTKIKGECDMINPDVKIQMLPSEAEGTPSPEPAPQPEADLPLAEIPESIPAPSPEPTPEPAPEPTPVIEPAPIPEPEITPKPESAPEPVPISEPALISEPTSASEATQ